MKKPLRWGSIIIGIVLCTTTWQFSQGKELYVQAWLAHGLLHTAWVRTRASGRQVKPWPWANTLPLARLSVPRLNVEQIVLSHTNKGMSAFALGHSDSSVLPGELGNSVLNAVHRDTYFAFLKVLKPGDMLVLESLRSGRWHYKVSAIYIVDKTNTYLVEPSLNRRLTLVSCYPCTYSDNRRYVVVAEEVERMA
ncbi:MAG: class D sortase [Candidatus Parabeggiatoa sp.]|nr:class D sortase [Candidatus Parabeggiatoa sp.]